MENIFLLSGMKEAEYRDKLKTLHDEYQKKVSELQAAFAYSNSPLKVGDVVSDHSTTIRIEKIQTVMTYGASLPSCLYFGVQLNKDGTPSKRQNNNAVYQCNIKKPPHY